MKNSAARALAAWRSDDVYQALQMVLQQKELVGTIEALSKFSRPEAVPELVADLEDDFCRSSAEDALRKLGALAHAALVDAARTPDPSGNRERPASQHRRGRALRLLENLQLTASDWQQVAALLYDPDPEISSRTGAIALKVGDRRSKEQAAKRLVDVLSTPDWLLRGEIQTWLENHVEICLPAIKEGIERRLVTSGRFGFETMSCGCCLQLDQRPREESAGRMEPQMIAKFIFDREQERQRIDQFLSRRRPFLLYGPSGVGKTLLLRNALSHFRAVLYCENSSTTNLVFRSLALSLLRLKSPRACKAFRDEDAITEKSAVSLKGIVMDALREGEYSIMLDHLRQPSYAFAAAVREIMSWGSTPVSAVARSSHMEDTGFLQPIYGDRSQKCEIHNFDQPLAEQFTREMIDRRGLSGTNLGEFLEKVLEFSAGNPGAMMVLVDMARYPKYRSQEHIKITPLYIDFRLKGGMAS